MTAVVYETGGAQAIHVLCVQGTVIVVVVVERLTL